MADENRKMDRKVVFEPYDMDTGIGTNNSGVLMFSPYLEDTDRVSSVISGGDIGGSEAPVYNAQDSVLWCNIRDAFRGELTQMYRNLRANGTWSYEVFERLFEEHQAKWPEAIFNEDAWVKYIIPLVDSVTVDETTGELIRTDRYLTMLQGSKQEQRKWWLFNRVRYLDSKYDTGNASANIINIRFFNSGTLTFELAVPAYAAVSFGGGTTPEMKRVDANTPVSFPYVTPAGVTEMETWIHSANLITRIEDLSQFYPNECDFSKAVLLRYLKIGDNTAGYSNANLTTIDVRNSPLLEYLDCRNCPRLGITVNLENSPRLTEAYFDGTIVTGVDLADGCVIEKLHLPGTITALTLLNLKKLSEFVLPDYSNISRLMLANMDQNIVDPVEVVNAIRPGSQVNIQGLYLELENAAAIEDFFDLLDTMTGVTRERSATTGAWIYHDEEKAIVSGEIHTTALMGSEIAAFNARYPFVTVTADHTTSYLYYYNYDGSQLLFTETILDGADGTYAGTPARASTPQNTYTFAGWTTVPNTSAQADALTHVVADRTVYAAYTAEGQLYYVRFVNEKGSMVQTVSRIPYGGTAVFTAEPPVKLDVDDPENYVLVGWNPSNENIQGDMICYPVFAYTGIVTRKIIDRTFEGPYTHSSVTKLGDYAFMSCSKLTGATFPEVTNIGASAFQACANVTSISFPKATSIGSYAFSGCSKITEAVFPNARNIERAAFNGCLSLRTASFPEVTIISSYAFTGCYRLAVVSFPMLESIGASAFLSCSSALVSVSFPKLNYIGTSAFYSCKNLSTFVLTNAETVCTLAASNAFGGISDITFYVPDEMVSEYCQAGAWSYYSSRIKGLSQLPENGGEQNG